MAQDVLSISEITQNAIIYQRCLQRIAQHLAINQFIGQPELMTDIIIEKINLLKSKEVERDS